MWCEAVKGCRQLFEETLPGCGVRQSRAAGSYLRRLPGFGVRQLFEEILPGFGVRQSRAAGSYLRRLYLGLV